MTTKEKYALRRSQTLCKACLSSRVYNYMHPPLDALKAALRRAAMSERCAKSGLISMGGCVNLSPM